MHTVVVVEKTGLPESRKAVSAKTAS